MYDVYTIYELLYDDDSLTPFIGTDPPIFRRAIELLQDNGKVSITMYMKYNLDVIIYILYIIYVL